MTVKPTVFAGREIQSMAQRIPYLQSSKEMGALCIGAVSLLRVQDHFITLSGPVDRAVL